jgi:hypothetical protein
VNAADRVRVIPHEVIMKTRMSILCWIVLFAIVGCRSRNPVIALLEQENTMLEDKIFEQQYELEQYREALQSSRGENQALRRSLTSEKSDEKPYGPTPAPPRSDTREGPSEFPDKLELPDIELPAEPTPQGELPERFRTRDSLQPDVGPPPRFVPTPAIDGNVPGEALLYGDNNRVASITLSRFLTGGLNSDEQDGDEGISVLIQPRNDAGEIVSAAAPVSVVVLDPNLEGQAARVGRWDFPADEVARGIQEGGLRQGIYLEMPWSSGPPAHGILQVYVRFTTDDGRDLEAHTSIRVDVSTEANYPPLVVPPDPDQQSRRRWQSKPQEPAPDRGANQEFQLASRQQRSKPPGSDRDTTSQAGRKQSESSQEPPQAATPSERAHPTWSPERPWPDQTE